MQQRLLAPRVARIAANIATVGFVVAAVLQVLLALGIVPITMAWGGTQSVLTAPVRIASVAAAAVMGLFAYVIRRRAGLTGGSHPSSAIRVLAWVITILLALNTLGNFASPSMGEAFLVGPLSLSLALACLLVAASGVESRDTLAPESLPALRPR
jgi:fucose 4-O-acetylase-like acetyltransferase